MSILYYLNIDNEKYQKIILSSWVITFFITTFDLIFELITGKNILGFESYIHGRLAGFFNDELIIGHFYYSFILITITYLLSKYFNKEISIFNKKYKLKNFIYIFILLFLAVSFFIGERSTNKILIMIFLFTFLFEKIIKIVLFSLFFSFIITILSINDKYQKRFVDQFINIYLKIL